MPKKSVDVETRLVEMVCLHATEYAKEKPFDALPMERQDFVQEVVLRMYQRGVMSELNMDCKHYVRRFSSRVYLDIYRQNRRKKRRGVEVSDSIEHLPSGGELDPFITQLISELPASEAVRHGGVTFDWRTVLLSFCGAGSLVEELSERKLRNVKKGLREVILQTI